MPSLTAVTPWRAGLGRRHASSRCRPTAADHRRRHATPGTPKAPARSPAPDGGPAPNREPDKPGAYSWNKAPRLAGQVVETGAIARQLVDGQPLIRAAVLAPWRHASTPG